MMNSAITKVEHLPLNIVRVSITSGKWSRYLEMSECDYTLFRKTILEDSR